MGPLIQAPRPKRDCFGFEPFAATTARFLSFERKHLSEASLEILASRVHSRFVSTPRDLMSLPDSPTWL